VREDRGYRGRGERRPYEDRREGRGGYEGAPRRRFDDEEHHERRDRRPREEAKKTTEEDPDMKDRKWVVDEEKPKEEAKKPEGEHHKEHHGRDHHEKKFGGDKKFGDKKFGKYEDETWEKEVEPVGPTYQEFLAQKEKKKLNIAKPQVREHDNINKKDNVEKVERPKEKV
jgi:hypothetical protein